MLSMNYVPGKEKSISFLVHDSFLEDEVRVGEVGFYSIGFDLLAFFESVGFVEVLSCVGDFLIDLAYN